MPPRWVLDESRAPVLVVTLDDQRGVETPDFDSLLVALAHVTSRARRGTIQVVLDLTGARPSAERRQRLAEWLRGDAWAVRDSISALAVVAPSPFLRGSITAIRWFFPDRAVRTETFDTLERALAWVRSRR